MQKGQVVKLDRGYPLVKCADGRLVRCEHATSLVKGEKLRAVIGDFVEVNAPEGHDKGIIEAICPRERAFVRKDPTERAVPQVLAANFDRVIVAQPLAEVNLRRLERELVLAYETGAAVTVVLTKADLAESEAQVEEVAARVRALAGPEVRTLVVSDGNAESVEAVRALMPENTTTVLIGKSGVGKSSLVNMLVGEDVQETGSVREGDGKGRHTTVSREMVAVPGGGYVVDMPGVRGLGLWDADAGIGAAFADIEQAAENCRFRDCSHESEPGCAVRAAVARGELSEERLKSTRTNRAAPCAPPWKRATSRPNVSPATRRSSRKPPRCARAARKPAACAAKRPATRSAPPAPQNPAARSADKGWLRGCFAFVRQKRYNNRVNRKQRTRGREGAGVNELKPKDVHEPGHRYPYVRFLAPPQGTYQRDGNVRSRHSAEKPW